MRLLRSVVDDVALGWRAPAGPLMTGALAALAVSGTLAALLGVFTDLHPGLIAVAAGSLQLALAYGIAGRVARKNGTKGSE